jgi:hypothetical protein
MIRSIVHRFVGTASEPSRRRLPALVIGCVALLAAWAAIASEELMAVYVGPESYGFRGASYEEISSLVEALEGAGVRNRGQHIAIRIAPCASRALLSDITEYATAQSLPIVADIPAFDWDVCPEYQDPGQK